MADVTGPLGAGELKERLTFQLRAAGTNELGEPNGAWADVFKRWAKAVTGSSAEAFAEGQMHASAPVTFLVRFCADITADMRIVWQGEPHEMVGTPVNVNGGRHTLRIEAVKGIRNGR